MGRFPSMCILISLFYVNNLILTSPSINFTTFAYTKQQTNNTGA